MRKVVIHGPGGLDVLRVEEAPDPVPGAGEVLLEVGAAGVNFADCVVRMGLYESAKKYVGWPITPGFEVAGRVAAVGEGVTAPAVGDAVVAVTRFGGYASHVVAPAGQVFARPPELSVEQAAAFPAVHLTAWYALHELAHVRPGARVLVHSAAGGVGGALLQLARLGGGRPVGVVGARHKLGVARELGAEVVIDKSNERLWPAAERAVPEGYDVVLDANGVETLRQSYAHLAPGGKLVVYGFHSMLRRGRHRPSWPKLAVDWLRTPRFDPMRMTGDNRSVLAFNLSYLFDRAALLQGAMTELLAAAAAGDLRSPPLRTLPMDRVAQAHGALESGTTVGKLVLRP
ncbi:MAG: synaptic vesicle VAT-1 family membrane protein [Myxococcota bacterium]